MPFTHIIVTGLMLLTATGIVYLFNLLLFSKYQDTKTYWRNFTVTVIGATVGVFLGFYWNSYLIERDNYDQVMHLLGAAVRESDMNVKIAILRRKEQLPSDREYVAAYVLPIEISNAFLKTMFSKEIFFKYFSEKFRRERLPTIYLISRCYDGLKNPSRESYNNMSKDFDKFKAWIDEEGNKIDKDKWELIDKSFSFTELMKMREKTFE
jgi:hypothetical protein